MAYSNTKTTAISSALAIVLAAGKGTRMESELPKVLVPVCDRPMLRYVTDALRESGIEQTVVVVGYQAELVRAELAGERGIDFAEQHEQLGTGHAVMMCRAQLAKHQGPVLVIAGDQCMVQVSSLRKLLEIFNAEQPACLLGTVDKDDPTGYGRIVRSPEGDFVGIVEQKDATDEQRAIREVNVSTYVFEASELLAALDQLTSKNAQEEFYLTDCPALLLAAGKRVSAHKVLQPCESMSINNMEELRTVEDEMRKVEI
ncbi:MAG: NTP transferase domain-containing protein [Planctomycetes bacterium]|nr:NTP transferase domain-containing protein [Planctomycetota bacterium]